MNEALLNKTEENVGVWVGQLHLSNFRNYDEMRADIAPGFNVLIGPNAQGKTNFLEALHFLATIHLLRGRRDSEAILEGREKARVEADLAPINTSIAIEIVAGTKKRAFLNTNALPRAADLVGRLPCVCLSMEDLELVRGDPAGRRLFLDLALSELYPAYLAHFTQYKRSLEQRNALLKTAQEQTVNESAFIPWEMHLASHGEGIRRMRNEFISEVAAAAKVAHARLGDGEAMHVSYQQSDSNVTQHDLLIALTSGRAYDIKRGSTTIGPHRDDMMILVQNRDARLFASQGQQRSAVIAVKLGTHSVIRDHLGFPPLLLLDDMLSDLDSQRRLALVDLVIDCAHQALLTCTDEVSAGSKILERSKIFDVNGGQIRERSRTA